MLLSFYQKVIYRKSDRISRCDVSLLSYVFKYTKPLDLQYYDQVYNSRLNIKDIFYTYELFYFLFMFDNIARTFGSNKFPWPPITIFDPVAFAEPLTNSIPGYCVLIASIFEGVH